MTREEREKAIDSLDNLLGMVEDNQDNDYDFALKMGIESLRQEPCEDAVSCKAIVEMLNAREQNSVMTFDHFIELLYKLPSVTPTQKWVPVKERLPKESLNSVIGWDAYRERCVFVQYIDGCFQIMGKDESFNIVAWMPLPKPYKETEGE